MNTESNKPDLAALDALVAAVENPELEIWAHAAEQARRAIEAARAPAHAQIFPDTIARLDGSAYSALAYHSELAPGGEAYGRTMADVHRRALGTHPELATLMRCPEERARVRAAAQNGAARLAREPGPYSDEVLTRYEIEIARQLVAAEHELVSHARVVLACDELARRLDTAITKHKERAAAALSLAEERRRAALRARAEESARRTAEATAEAERLDAESKRAARRARQVRGEGIMERFEALGITEIRVAHGDGHEVWRADFIRGNAQVMADVQLARIESALGKLEAKA